LIHLPRDNQDVMDLAQATINTPAAIEIAKMAAKSCNVAPGVDFNQLRFWLAHAYASGFVRGRKGRGAEQERPVTPDPLGPNV